jgi:predicted nucleotidyltransferase
MIENHYRDVLKKVPEDRVLGVFLEGSQNYGMSTENSDIDTKAYLLPGLGDIVFCKDPISTTWIRENEEHISAKDIRLVMNCFRKQNFNFVETLFTPYRILNPKYEKYLEPLFENREKIARYNPYAATMAMWGLANNNMKRLCSCANGREYYYKALYQLKRIEYVMESYIKGLPYALCMYPPKELRDECIAIKHGCYTKDEAVKLADEIFNHIAKMRRDYTDKLIPYKVNEEIDRLLDEVLSALVTDYLEERIKWYRRFNK